MVPRWKYRHLYPSCVRDPRVRVGGSLADVDPRIFYLKWSHFKLLSRACARLDLPAEDLLDLWENLLPVLNRRF